MYTSGTFSACRLLQTGWMENTLALPTPHTVVHFFTAMIAIFFGFSRLAIFSNRFICHVARQSFSLITVLFPFPCRVSSSFLVFQFAIVFLWHFPPLAYNAEPHHQNVIPELSAKKRELVKDGERIWSPRRRIGVVGICSRNLNSDHARNIPLKTLLNRNQ